MKKKAIHRIILSACTAALLFSPALAQEKTADYMALYKKGDYSGAVRLIYKNLDTLYSTRVKDKRVPVDFITVKRKESDIDLMRLFKERRATGFFIEDNPELSKLHMYAGRCHFQLKEYNMSLSHFTQSLRFMVLTPGRDDTIYYEISQVFLARGDKKAYYDTLETAYTLNPENVSYSLELGRALYRTSEKKRAILHLERYAAKTGENVKPEVLLMIGNLYEDTGRYIETEKYYQKYLEKVPENGHMHFALGWVAYSRTGNHGLAVKSFKRALEILPAGDIFRRSRSHEYLGDIALQDLSFSEAKRNYEQTTAYQEKIAIRIKEEKDRIRLMEKKINDIKASLMKDKDFDRYEEYEFMQEEIGGRRLKLGETEFEYRKLNPGRARWNLAYSCERLGQLQEAVKYYRACISFDYRPVQARQMIRKLRLKIKRGY